MGTDLVLLLVLAAFACNGILQGMLRQLVSAGGFVVGLLLAQAFYRPLSAGLGAFIAAEGLREAYAFAGTILGVWLLANLVAILARRRTRQEGSNWADDIGGALVGLCTGVLALMIVCLGMVRLGTLFAEEIAASTIGGWLLRTADVAIIWLGRRVPLPVWL